MPLLSWIGAPLRRPARYIAPPVRILSHVVAFDAVLPLITVAARATVLRDDEWLAGIPSDNDDAVILEPTRRSRP